MFGLFRTKPPPSVVRVAPDLVYIDHAARNAAVARFALGRVSAGLPVALVTPFRGHIPSLREALSPLGLATATLDVSYRDAAPPPDSVYVLEAAALPLFVARLAGPQAFVQVERHPLREHDLAVEAALEAHSKRHQLYAYLSLDDGLFALFNPDGSIKKLMRSLEMDAAEPIEHSMVTSSIENAQAKIAKKVKLETPADTFDDWRAKNLAPR